MKANVQIEGFWDVIPKIKRISFDRGKISVYLEDGRTVIVPVSKFPGIKKLDSQQRQKWYLFGNGFSFNDSDEVYHIEQILGNYQVYHHENL